MNKEIPSVAKVLTMLLFTLSCFGLLLFLWLAFGGSVPLKPEAFRFKVAFPEAATLSLEADVRLAGVNIGKVKKMELAQGAARTVVELEVEDEYAPIPDDSRAILRQKTLLGETFVELSPGSPFAQKLPENAKLPDGNVEETVQLDEILRIFDNPTKRAFGTWVKELAAATKGDTGQDLNDALGNLPSFAAEGGDVLAVLDEQQKATSDWIRNTGRLFNALNRRKGELSDLIVNQSRFFSATQARDDELAETIRLFPTFLDETRVTQARLARFATDTRPLVRELGPVADDLGPTVRDLGDLGPDLAKFFEDLDPLIQESDETLPEGARVIRGLAPVLESVHTFFPEFNPFLSYLNFQKQQLADFLSVPGFAIAGAYTPKAGSGPRHFLPQIAVINNRSLESDNVRQANDRGNAYLAPNANNRFRPAGINPESFDCRSAGGEQPDPRENLPPCLVQPPSLFDGNQYPRLQRGEAPVKPSPYTGNEGTRPVRPGR
jgi:phospholipid/cholesterol/gamma-HCH transport system substrate-binding protein